MRRISLVLIFFIAFGTVSSSAEQPRSRERAERFSVGRLVRAVRSIFQPRTNSDGLTPPLPAPAPPRP